MKAKLCVFVILIAVSMPLFGDVIIPGDRCVVYSHVSGFKDFPEVDFYTGHELRGNFSFTRVETDTLTYKISGWSSTFVSWNPIFSKLVPGKDYKDNEEPFFLGNYSVGIDQTSSMTALILGFPFREFDQIDRYYKVNKTKLPAANGNPNIEVVLDKVVYQARLYRIEETGDFDAFLHYMCKRSFTSATQRFSYGKYNQADKEIIAFARTLKNHKVIEISSLAKTKIAYFERLSANLQYLMPFQAAIIKHGRLFVYAFFLSILIEMLVLRLLFKPVCRIQEPLVKKLWMRIMLVCAMGTAFTITIIWWIFPLFVSKYNYWPYTQEAFAFVAEAFIYFWLLKIPLKKGFFLSAACNLASYAAGLLLFTYLIKV